jgi:hypothetical protein
MKRKACENNWIRIPASKGCYKFPCVTPANLHYALVVSGGQQPTGRGERDGADSPRMPFEPGLDAAFGRVEHKQGTQSAASDQFTRGRAAAQRIQSSLTLNGSALLRSVRWVD